MCKIFLFYISQKITIGNFIIQIVPVYMKFQFLFFFFFFFFFSLVKKKQISNICSVFFLPEFEREFSTALMLFKACSEITKANQSDPCANRVGWGYTI